MEKSLYAAPLGLEQMIPANAPDIEIEIEDPESVDIHMDDLSIHMEPDETDDDFNPIWQSSWMILFYRL